MASDFSLKCNNSKDFITQWVKEMGKLTGPVSNKGKFKVLRNTMKFICKIAKNKTATAENNIANYNFLKEGNVGLQCLAEY